MVSVAVLGCGYWAPNLLRNFAETPCFHVVACADSNAARFERLAWCYPGVCFTTDCEQVLHDDAIDAVAMSTPAETHYPLAREALLCGKHVLVEKPLATSVAHAQELVQIARCNGRMLMVDHTCVYTCAVRKIRELVEHEELGEVYYFDSVRFNLGLFRHDVSLKGVLAPVD